MFMYDHKTAQILTHLPNSQELQTSEKAYYHTRRPAPFLAIKVLTPKTIHTAQTLPMSITTRLIAIMRGNVSSDLATVPLQSHPTLGIYTWPERVLRDQSRGR